MDLNAIAVFVKVVETGSFSAAARLLEMPKQTVSAKVAGLEKYLGVSLIQRTTRKLHVTDAGESYFRHCANAIREAELGEAALQSARGRPSGVLKVTAPVDVGHALLPRIVGAYVDKYPDVSVELLITNRTVDLVGEGIDLAIRPAAALKDSSLIARRFFEVDSNLWTSPRYLQKLGKPTQPRDLANATFVGRVEQKSVVLTNGKADVEVSLAGRVYADDFEAIKALIVHGLGIAWLPEFLARDAVEAGTLVPVLPRWAPKLGGTFYFVYAGRKYTSPKVQHFIQMALQVA